MARVVVTEPADADTAEIQAYLEREAGSLTASKYSDSFESLYERLTAHPDSGAPRPDLGPHVRTAIVAPYVVIYRHVADDDVVAIIRIVHGSRNITRRLLRGAS
jgi:plasmid stabilization system protein ParE